MQIIAAMGWPVPVYAHLPLLHGEDGAKLSKRHGALGIHEYQDLGYLPEAMRNYLLRLGWSHGDDEIISTAQAIEWFNLESIGRSPARVDFKKLDNLNGHYMRGAEPGLIAGEALRLMARKGSAPLSPQARAQFEMAIPSLKERAKTLNELIEGAAFLFAVRPLQPDAKAAKILTDGARALLARLRLTLADTDWDAGALESSIKAFADAEGRKLGDIAQPLRAALTGQATSPGIYDVLVVLGRDESLGRIADAQTAT
jgi:glutamyl-tRNA synthetase